MVVSSSTRAMLSLATCTRRIQLPQGERVTRRLIEIIED
jgi:hypothetical protein